MVRSKEAKKQESVILSDPRALLRKAATGGVEGSDRLEHQCTSHVYSLTRLLVEGFR